MAINRKPTDRQLRKLWNTVAQYVQVNGVSCEEHIMQSDEAQVNALTLAEDACRIVGYVDLD